MSDDRTFAERNARSQHRLQQVVSRLNPDEFALVLPDGLTIAATLAHIAFWDRWVLGRWQAFARDGDFAAYPDQLLDLANAALAPQWAALPATAAVDLALTAAAEVDAAIEALPTPAVARAVETGRPALVDRSLHRDPHLDAIEAAPIGR